MSPATSGHDWKPRISLIIPVYNEEKFLPDLLDSLKAQTYPPALTEILIVDGDSQDRSREILQARQSEFADLKILHNSRRITPISLNIGLRAAQGEILIRWDAHAIYAADYLEACVQALASSGADNVGGPVRMLGNTPVREAIRLATTCSFGIGNSHYHYLDREGDVDTVTFGAFRRSILEKVGLFDEELIRNQDDELNFRINLSGGRCFLTPRIRSWYYPRNSLKALWRQYYQYGYWKVRVIQKHHRPASLRHLVPGGFALTLYTGLLGLLYHGWGLLLLLPLCLAYLPLLFWFSLRLPQKSLKAAKESEPLPGIAQAHTHAGLLAAVFVILHLSYGTGFLKGLWSFGWRGLLKRQRHKEAQF